MEFIFLVQFTISEKYNHACDAYDRELSRVTADKRKTQRELDQCIVKLDDTQKQCIELKDGIEMQSQTNVSMTVFGANLILLTL